MSKLNNLGLKRFNQQYRVDITNEDTVEEVVSFSLNRKTLYIASSVIFILLVGFTLAIIVYTPLKFYIPGYGSRQNRSELENLKIKTDSLEKAVFYKDEYLKRIRIVLSGGDPAVLDTNSLKIPTPKDTMRK